MAIAARALARARACLKGCGFFLFCFFFSQSHLNNVDLIKIPASPPGGNLISISLCVYLSGHRGAVSALPCRLADAGFPLAALQKRSVFTSHIHKACLAVKWLRHRHAQFVSFHPGLMSRIYPGAKCTV